MRVLVVGAGGVGGYFGGRLLEAGRDVTFLVRSGRRKRLAADGLSIRSVMGDVTLPAPTVLSEEIKEPWDLVLLSCKAYDLDDAMDSLAPAVGSGSVIVPLLNGMAHLDALDARFGRPQVLGGLCVIAATVTAEGVIQHLNDTHTLVFGERDGGISARGTAIADLFTPAKVTARQTATIILEMWEKWVFLASLAAGSCLMRASVGDIVRSGGGGFMGDLLAEAGAIADSAGYPPRADSFSRFVAQLTAADSSMTASMLRDIENGGEVEADHIIGDLLDRGRLAGRPQPLLSTAYLHLKSYQARRRRLDHAASVR